MKKILAGVFLLFVICSVYLAINLIRFKSSQIEVPAIQKIDIEDQAINRLQEAIKIKTISYQSPSDFDSIQFDAFNNFLRDSYPLVHHNLEHKVFNKYSHLFTWKGSNPNLKPILLMAHHDVVPIAAPDKWSIDPFGGSIVNGSIWGRGAMDDKYALIAILEAVEMMLSSGQTPARSVILSFGHDEEIGGRLGAVTIAQYLKEQGISPEYVLDEGMAITSGLIPGVRKNIAFIGTAEKGIVSLEMTVNQEGGHSSQPAKETAIDILAVAVAKLKANPMEGRLSTTLVGFMDKIGPEMSFLSRLVFANRGIFKSLIIKMYGNMSNSGNALIRTTTSPTIFQAGVKENVIPASARAVINFRIIPGELAEDVMEHARKIVNDKRVEMEYFGPLTEPSPESPINSSAYLKIEQTIKEVFSGVLTSPNLVIGATDSRHFTELTRNIYRFSPFTINKDNLTCFHGVDERVPVSEFYDAIRFYKRLIEEGE